MSWDIRAEMIFALQGGGMSHAFRMAIDDNAAGRKSGGFDVLKHCSVTYSTGFLVRLRERSTTFPREPDVPERRQ